MSPVSGNLLVLIVACMSGANWLFMDLMRDQCLKIYMVRSHLTSVSPACPCAASPS